MNIFTRFLRVMITLVVFLLSHTFLTASIRALTELIPIQVKNLFDLNSYRFFTNTTKTATKK